VAAAIVIAVLLAALSVTAYVQHFVKPHS
jgi:hypothetical protein